MTFLPASRLARARRSLARWHASEACPKGISSAGHSSSCSRALATWRRAAAQVWTVSMSDAQGAVAAGRAARTHASKRWPPVKSMVVV